MARQHSQNDCFRMHHRDDPAARDFALIIACFLLFEGIGLNVHSMYLGESAPKELRGLVSLTRAMFVAFGKFVGQVIGLR